MAETKKVPALAQLGGFKSGSLNLDIRVTENRSSFATPEGPPGGPSGVMATGVTYSRIGRWYDNSHYDLGASKVRLFSGIAEPVVMQPGTDPDGSREKARLAAEWGLGQTRDGEACAHVERIDFPAVQNQHMAIAGFYNVTTGDWGWAAFFIREGGRASGGYLSNVTDTWYLRYGWFEPWWFTGTDQREIKLSYADNDGRGLAWYWSW